MFTCLDKFLQVLARILYRSEIYPTRVNKLTIFALYRIVNTSIYNQGKDSQGHSDGIGVIVSPIKFKNFEP